ncbi:hypothetical protein BFW01_g5742 [Lasiodiplodia theobromae]|nr:hypothetical protein BFW01_g5742 [Lasiodiplodia theobromae]
MAGAGVAILGIVDVVMAADGPALRPLFPQDEASRTSNGGWLESYNTISAIKVSITCGHNLNIKIGVKLEAETEQISLSDRHSPDPADLSWTSFFPLL